MPGPAIEASPYDNSEERTVRDFAADVPRARAFVLVQRGLGIVVTFYRYPSHNGGAYNVTARTCGSLILKDTLQLPLLSLVRQALGVPTLTHATTPLFLQALYTGDFTALTFELLAPGVCNLVAAPEQTPILRPLYGHTAFGDLVPLATTSLGTVVPTTFKLVETKLSTLSVRIQQVTVDDIAANTSFRAAHGQELDYKADMFVRGGYYLMLLDARLMSCEPWYTFWNRPTSSPSG